MDGSDAPQPYIVLVCFLVREGAETTLTNKKGHTPLQLCSAKAISTIMTLKIRYFLCMQIPKFTFLIYSMGDNCSE